MSVDYSVVVMYGVELFMTRNAFYNNVDSTWNTREHKVEIGVFGNHMSGDKFQVVAFYQPSYTSFDIHSSKFGAWSFDELSRQINTDEAITALDEATEELPTIGKPSWFLASNVS